ncbi:MAG: hypothetical protein R2828_10810 [Saprospiraceae bacterium]
MKNQVNLLASIGLAIGAIFGMSGLLFTSPITQLCLFVISGVGFTAGLSLLAVKFLREQNDLLATGFLLFAIGEAISTLNAAADEATSLSAFAGCMLFYAVGFALVCFPPKFVTWTRITGLLSALIFLIAATRFYLGYGIDTSDTLPGIGYGLLTITIAGWIVFLLKERAALKTNS